MENQNTEPGKKYFKYSGTIHDLYELTVNFRNDWEE
jgi:hypothetical protein